MYRLVSLLSILMLYTSLLFAQEQRGGKSPEMRAKFEAQKISYITQQLEISPEEAQVFWPLYNELKKKKDVLNGKHRKLFRALRNETDSLTPQELSKISDELAELKVTKAQLELEYHYKFKKVISPQQVVRLYQAEKHFQNMLLRQLKGHGARRHRGNGRN